MPTRPGRIALGTAVGMMAAGVALIGDDWWKRGFLAMAALLVVQSCVSLAQSCVSLAQSCVSLAQSCGALVKTLRDAPEAGGPG